MIVFLAHAFVALVVFGVLDALAKDDGSEVVRQYLMTLGIAWLTFQSFSIVYRYWN